MMVAGDKDQGRVTTDPLASVIIRTCNRPFLVKRAIQSVLNQSYHPIELVIVDDGRYKINTSFLAEIRERVQVTYIPTRSGRSRAGNIGIRRSRGEFIFFLDDDDELYPEHISRLIYHVLRYDGIVYSDSELSFEAYDEGVDVFSEKAREVKFSFDFSRPLLMVRNYIPLMCICFPRVLLEAVNGFDESVDLFEDWDLLIRLSFLKDFLHVPVVTAKYRIWSQDQRTREAEDTEEAYLKVAGKHFSRLTPKDLYTVFLFTEQLMQLSKLQKEKELDAKQIELETSKKKLEKKLEELEGIRTREIKSMEAELSAIQREKNEEVLGLRSELQKLKEIALATKEETEDLRKENRRLHLQNGELAAINRLYVEENMRKEAYILQLQVKAQSPS
jgi:glycosyltransferase involved in cell wall biosynthesis